MKNQEQIAKAQQSIFWIGKNKVALIIITLFEVFAHMPVVIAWHAARSDKNSN